MKKILHLFSALTLTLFLSACGDDDNDEENFTVPTNITFQSNGLFPEDFSYSPSQRRFFAGSIRQGSVVAVALDGTVTPFIESDDLISVIGITLDDANNQLYVCNADPGFSVKNSPETMATLSTVVRYNSLTGEQTGSFDLAALAPEGTFHTINDLVLDDAGNLYVTDSFSPIIYRVTPEGVASIFLTDPSLGSPAGQFGLNGIEFHPDGFLIATNYSRGELYKIPVNNPTSFTTITVDQDIFSADGIRLLDNNNLVLVSNILMPAAGGENIIYSLNSTDNWTTATVNGQINEGNNTTFPTTVELVNGNPYVINAFLAELLAGNADITDFRIRAVTL